MGDNIYIGDRNGVRTPMQWSIDRNAGFSRADPQRLYLPLIMDPIYGYQAVNVEAQSRDPSSLLNWTRRILAVRRQHQSFGRGTLEFVRPQNRKVIAYLRSFGAEVVLCVANLSQSAQAVELELLRYKGRVPVELLGGNAFPPVGDLPYFLTLPAHGFFWLLLSESATPPAWHVERLPATELPVLVLTEGIRTLLANASEPALRGVARRTLQELQHEVLPEFMRQRGWFRAGDGAEVRFGERIPWHSDQGEVLLTFVYVEGANGVRQRYSLPLTVAWEDGADSGVLRTAEWTLAKVREHARVGVLVDAFADPAFCMGIVQSIASSERVPFNNGVLRFESTPVAMSWNSNELLPLRHVGGEQPHTSVVMGEKVLLKAYRRAEAGINPDVEMIHHLVSQQFRHVPPLGGTVVCEWASSPPITLAAAFAFVGNQGDAWTYSMDHLDRVAAELRTSAAPDGKSPHDLFNARMQAMGRRVGELHGVLCVEGTDPAFAPEPINDADLAAWNELIGQLQDRGFALLQEKLVLWRDAALQSAQRLVEARDWIRERIRVLLMNRIDSLRVRHHGFLSLRSVLLVADDFLIVDFDGDPALGIEQRRAKHSPLRDVASMLRSFDKVRVAALERARSNTADIHARVIGAFADWRDQASDAFLKGYRVGVGNARCVPASSADFDRLIELFQFELLLQELQDALTHSTASAFAIAPVEALLGLSRRQ
jgi:maltose alpha-D-glucosyltransferase/alpha-amylase